MKYIALLFLSISFSIFANAGTFAIFGNDRITECKESKESLDSLLREMSLKFGACEVKTGTGSMIKGYILHCGPNNMQMLYRSKSDCELLKKQMNGGAEAAPEAFAPHGIKNPTGWVVAMDGCMTKAAPTDKAVAKIGLQKLNDYCICASTKVASYYEKELTAAIAKRVVKECSGILNSNVPKGFEAKTDKIIDDKMKSIPKPMAPKDSIQVSPDLNIYEHWFFAASPQDFSKMAYLKAKPEIVRVGQRFGFTALVTNKKPSAHLHVELRVPKDADHFPVHDQKFSVAVSADGKTVVVDGEEATEGGTIAFYWGIADGDPLGRYEFKYAVDGVPIETYTFDVKP